MEPAATVTTTTTAPPAAEPMLIAGYPLWSVALVGGLAIVLAFWLFARAFRLLAALVALGVLAGASWIAWQYVFG